MEYSPGPSPIDTHNEEQESMAHSSPSPCDHVLFVYPLIIHGIYASNACCIKMQNI